MQFVNQALDLLKDRPHVVMLLLLITVMVVGKFGGFFVGLATWLWGNFEIVLAVYALLWSISVDRRTHKAMVHVAMFNHKQWRIIRKHQLMLSGTTEEEAEEILLEEAIWSNKEV